MEIYFRQNKVTKLPSHPQPDMRFMGLPNKEGGRGLRDSFNYIAPVVKYAPAAFQPGPVYRGGEAAAIGKQPYNWSDVWTAYSTPKQPSHKYLQGYKGSQSTASFSVAQNAMAMLLNNRGS